MSRLKRFEPLPVKALKDAEAYGRLIAETRLGGAIDIMCGVENLDGCRLVDACKGKQRPWHWALAMVEQALDELKHEGWTIEPPVLATETRT